jgi:hypothetical protein
LLTGAVPKFLYFIEDFEAGNILALITGDTQPGSHK